MGGRAALQSQPASALEPTARACDRGAGGRAARKKPAELAGWAAPGASATAGVECTASCITSSFSTPAELSSGGRAALELHRMTRVKCSGAQGTGSE